MQPNGAVPYQVIINGTAYTEWLAVTVARSLERMSGEFQVDLTKRQPTDLFLTDGITPGLPAQIEIDGQTFLDGFIDAVSYTYNGQQASITVKGRDKTCDLIDCAARVDDKFEFTNQKLDAVIKKIIAPYGLTLKVETDTGAVFKRLAVQPGETAYEFIERACRLRGVLAVSDGIGGLTIIKPAGEKSAGRLVYGENILAADVDLDDKDVFSLYVVKGQAEPVAADDEEVKVSVTAEGRATDELVKRYRPKVIVGENQAYDMTLKERAAWEKKMARARSKRATYTVTGWRAAQGALWKVNTLVPVSDKRTGLNREMLITGLRFTRDNGGTRTQIELSMPEAFDIPAEKDTTSGASEIWVADE